MKPISEDKADEYSYGVWRVEVYGVVSKNGGHGGDLYTCVRKAFQVRSRRSEPTPDLTEVQVLLLTTGSRKDV